MKSVVTAVAVLAAMTFGAWAENEVTATPAVGGDAKPAGVERGKDIVRGDRGNQFMQEMIKKYDTDGDGKLSEQERNAASVAREQEMQTRMLERFSAMDKDGNGSISKEEWLASFKDMRGPMVGRGRGGEVKKADDGKKADANTAIAPVKGDKAEGAAPSPVTPEATPVNK